MERSCLPSAAICLSQQQPRDNFESHTIRLNEQCAATSFEQILDLFFLIWRDFMTDSRFGFNLMNRKTVCLMVRDLFWLQRTHLKPYLFTLQ